MYPRTRPRGCCCVACVRCGANSTLPYLHRSLPWHAEASMKLIPQRARSLVQTDMFATATAPARVTGLQLHRDDLVELLSQLMWQVASQTHVAQRLEDDDEQ